MEENRPKRVKLADERPVGFRWVSRYATVALGADSAYLEALWYSLDLDYRAQRAAEEHIESFVKPELERLGLAAEWPFEFGSPEDPKVCLEMFSLVGRPLPPGTRGFSVIFFIRASTRELCFAMQDHAGRRREWPPSKSGQWKAALSHFLHCYKEGSALVKRASVYGLRGHSHTLTTKNMSHMCLDMVQMDLNWSRDGFTGLGHLGTPRLTGLGLSITFGPGPDGDWTMPMCSVITKSGLAEDLEPEWHSALKSPLEGRDVFSTLDTYVQNLIRYQEENPLAFIL